MKCIAEKKSRSFAIIVDGQSTLYRGWEDVAVFHPDPNFFLRRTLLAAHSHELRRLTFIDIRNQHLTLLLDSQTLNADYLLHATLH